MKLSVIIVNYNVRAYLEQCLRTVFEALKEVDGDVFVVDNLSTDGSVEMVREKFQQVKLIANRENVGFSRANNQAIRESTAEYVVLLNPDTVVGEDVFQKVVSFLDAHPKAGGLGVKMIDGTGRFLPESKRGLPTPAVAFYKIVGLTRLFPRSRIFGRYHLGHLPENEAAPIEILSGACMFLRKKTLDQVGLLDESFFMYGEDIDLSYRITLGGYENWYLPEARIIHYKGESTKKSSVNYVFVFYNAMAIFARKHFTRKRSNVLAGLINASIYLSAAGAIVMRFLRRALLPLLDALLLIGCLCLVPDRTLWERDGVGDLLFLFLQWTIPTIVVLGLFGGYDLPVRMLRALLGSAVSVLLLATVLFPQDVRGEPGLLWPLIALWFMVPVTVRLMLHMFRVRGYSLRDIERQRVLAIGDGEETRHALALLWQTHFGLGRQQEMEAAVAMGTDAPERIRREIRKEGIDEVVFCAKDMKWQAIIHLMEKLNRSGVLFKIAQPAREFIIGPSTIESLQDLLVMDAHSLNSSASRRQKRTLDLALSVLFTLTLPVSIWFVGDRSGFIRNIMSVVKGDRSWVGYFPGKDGVPLPRLRAGVLDPVHADHLRPLPLTVQRMNLEYAKDYRVLTDLRRVMRNFSSLGR